MRAFVLWDVDGTLVDAAQAGRAAYGAALAKVLGVPVESQATTTAMVAMAGRTDHEIALELLARAGLDDSARHVGLLHRALADGLAARTELIRRRGRALPGARAVLAALHADPGVLQSVLTGNIEPNAALKLAAFGLDSYVDLEVGGFGSEPRPRPALVAIAQARAKEKYGRSFGPRDTVLVGDTPLDVAAGRQGGARVVAVATGRFSAQELDAAGADAVLPDLTDTGRAVEAILGR
jgi:phosphoglycolate phosphatase